MYRPNRELKYESIQPSQVPGKPPRTFDSVSDTVLEMWMKVDFGTLNLVDVFRVSCEEHTTTYPHKKTIFQYMRWWILSWGLFFNERRDTNNRSMLDAFSEWRQLSKSMMRYRIWIRKSMITGSKLTVKLGTIENVLPISTVHLWK